MRPSDHAWSVRYVAALNDSRGTTNNARLPPRPADAAQRVPAHARQARGLGVVGGPREAVDLALQRQLETAAQAAAPACAQLRAALVRRRDKRVAALQHLPALRARVEQPVAAGQAERPLDAGARGQQARRQAAAAAGKVLPPGVVGHPQRFDAVVRAAGQRAVLLPLQHVALAVGHAVVGQQAQVQAALQRRLQVAEFGVGTKAAPRDDARRDRRVAVGRDVPVVRHGQLQAALRIEVHAGAAASRTCGRR